MGIFIGLQIFTKIKDYKNNFTFFSKNKKIRFIPTMGIIHKGYISY